MLHADQPLYARPARAALRAACRPTRFRTTLALEPTARTLDVETDDERVQRYVRTAYAKVVVAVPDPGHVDDRGQLLRADSPPVVCFNGTALPRDTGSWSSDAYVVDQFVWRSLAGDCAWLPLYGCTIAFGGRAVIIVGPSGIGKTTLGLALAAAGAKLGGDEMVLVHRRTRTVTALRRALTVRGDCLPLIDDARISATVGRFGEPLGDGTSGVVALDAARLAPLSEPQPLGAFVIAERGTDMPRLEPMSSARVALAVAPYVTPRPPDLSAVADLVDLFGPAAGFRLVLSGPRETAALLLERIVAC